MAPPGRFELLTPRGAGGVAVLAVRGPDRWECAARLLREPDGAPLRPPGVVPRLLILSLDGAPTDEVLVVDRPERATVELHLHGSPAVLAAVEASVGGFHAPPARRGEALLQQARNRAQLQLALEQRELDFDAFLRAATPAQIAAAVARSRPALALVEPQTLVLCGAQNAGKSTLMNRLLFAERVLTGDLPGLTRDPVRERVELDGYPYEIVDTAGEGEVADALDRAALQRGRAERGGGALLVLVVDGSRPPTAADVALWRERAPLLVRSKADLPPADWPGQPVADLTLTCIDPAAAGAVRTAVGAALRRRRGLPAAGPAGGIAALSRDELARLEAASR